MTTDDLTRRAIIAAHDAECSDRHCEAVHMPSLNKREAAIVEAWRADVGKLTERIERYQRLDVIHMKTQLRMTRTLDEALGLAEADCDMCVPGCDEGAQGAEHLMHHLIQRDAERGAAIKRVRAITDDLATSHRRTVAGAITDEYERGRVHAEDDLWRRLGAALDGTEQSNA